MRKFIFILLLIAILPSCSSISDKQMSSNVSYSVEYGFYHESGKDSNQLVHKIEEYDEYSPTVFIKNNYPDKYTFRLYCMIDYKLYPLNNNNYIDISLASGEEKSFPISLSNKFQQGLHDVIIIIVRDPDNLLEEKQYVSPEFVYFSRRVSLLVSTDSVPDIKYTIVDVKNMDKKDRSSTPYITINKDDKFSDLISKISRNELSTLNLHYNTDGKETSAAIIAIQQKEQIQISESFIKYAGSGDIIVPNNPSTLIPSNLIIGFVRNPFMIQNVDVFSSDVLFTNLTTITE